MSIKIGELFNSKTLGAVLAHGQISEAPGQALLMGPLEPVFRYDSEKKVRTNETVGFRGDFVFVKNRFLRQSVKFETLPSVLATLVDSDYPIFCTFEGLEAGVLNNGYIYAKARGIKEVESYDF